MFFTTEVSLQKCAFLHEHYEVKFPEKNATPVLLKIPHSWLTDSLQVYVCRELEYSRYQSILGSF